MGTARGDGEALNHHSGGAGAPHTGAVPGVPDRTITLTRTAQGTTSPKVDHHTIELIRPPCAPCPAGDPDRIALPIAGDDGPAKAKVRSLIDELGFDTVDAGGLDESWRQQPETPVYGLQEGVDAVTKALAEASPERTPDFKA